MVDSGNEYGDDFLQANPNHVDWDASHRTDDGVELGQVTRDATPDVGQDNAS